MRAALPSAMRQARRRPPWSAWQAIAAGRRYPWSSSDPRIPAHVRGDLMQIGIVGLGRMGAGMARRAAQAGISVLCYDRADSARTALEGMANVQCAENLAALCARLEGERVIILMLPAGEAVEDTI